MKRAGAHGAAALDVPVLASARQKAELPVISQTAYRLLLMLSEREHHLHDLEDLVETDPALTGKVLGVANSAAFHVGSRRCLTVRDAVNRIGTVTTMEIAAQFALAGCFRTQPDAREVVRAMWVHALTVAYQAKELASVTTLAPAVDPEVAYSGGLLHDIGYLVMLSVAPGLAPVMRRALVNGAANEDTFAGALQEDSVTNHEEFGYELLKQWRIPQPLPEVLRNLHEPDRWPWSNAGALSLCHVLYAADIVVRNEQRHAPEPLAKVAQAHAEEFEALKLGADELAAAVAAARRRAGAIQAMAETMAA